MFQNVISLTIFLTIIFFPLHASVINGSAGNSLKAQEITNFVEPWAMTFINDQQLLVTSKRGKVWLVSINGEKKEVFGVPKVFFEGQGGLGDVIVHPDFEKNQLIYLSFVSADIENTSLKGATVVRCKFTQKSGTPFLTDVKLIWNQIPKMRGSGHFSHRLAFGPKGSIHEDKLFITSGDRQEGMLAQDWKSSVGKIIRLNSDGTVPKDNPFQDKGELAKSFWTLGHRNALGIAFDKNGNLWSHEMGPRHGDELNLIKGGMNYGWPFASEGNHYDGRAIPDHASQPQFFAPVLFWVPTIAPSGFFFYTGTKFNHWIGDAFIGGLRSKALIRINFSKSGISESERYSWGSRVREVEQGPEGSIWVLEDPPFGRLIKFDTLDQ